MHVKTGSAKVYECRVGRHQVLHKSYSTLGEITPTTQETTKVLSFFQ